MHDVMDHGISANRFDEFSAALNLASLITEQIDAIAADADRLPKVSRQNAKNGSPMPFMRGHFYQNHER